MKIKDIKTFILRQDIGDKAFHSSQARFSIRSSMIVRIEAEDGAVGWEKGDNTVRPSRRPLASTMSWRPS
jgi:L-alanine-DL-glutamate epimerase-like enolase superfamily enzyme